MVISIIVAAAENNVIGHNNDLIWHLPSDMKYFQSKTVGHHVLMGRKNYESIPEKFRPLPNRKNIVVTRQNIDLGPQVTVVNAIDNGVDYARSNDEEELFIIGGGEIYRQSMDIADKIYLTRVHESFEGDTFFPELDDSWQIESEEFRKADDKNVHDMTFYVYTRK